MFGFASFKLSYFATVNVRNVNERPHEGYTLEFTCISKLNPLKPKPIQIIFKHSVPTANKTPHFTIANINRLTLFKKIIAVYYENHTELINTFSGQNAELLTVKAGDTYTTRL
jgi:hypothetical protein